MGYFDDDSEIRSELAWKKAKVFWLFYCFGAYIFYACLISFISGFKHTGTGDAISYMLIPFFISPQSVFVAAFFYVFRIEIYALGSKTEAFILGVAECWLAFYPPDFLRILDDITLITPLCFTAAILLIQGILVRLYKRYKHEPYCNDEELTETDDLSVAEKTGNKTIYRVRLYIKSTWGKTVSFYIYYSLTFCLVTFISAALDLVDAIAGCLMALVFLSTQAAVTCAVFYILGIERYALGSKIEALVLGMVEGYIMMFGYGVGFINSFMEKLAGDMSFILSPTLLTALMLLPQGILTGICRFRRDSRWRGGRRGRL